MMVESQVNVDSWKLEVERVAPSLKVTLRSESRDWRAHLEQIYHHRNNMEGSLGSAVTDLGNRERERESCGDLTKLLLQGDYRGSWGIPWSRRPAGRNISTSSWSHN